MVITPVTGSEPPTIRFVIVEAVLTKSVTTPDLANKLVPTSTVSASMLVALTVVNVKSVPLRVVATPTATYAVFASILVTRRSSTPLRFVAVKFVMIPETA